MRLLLQWGRDTARAGRDYPICGYAAGMRAVGFVQPIASQYAVSDIREAPANGGTPGLRVPVRGEPVDGEGTIIRPRGRFSRLTAYAIPEIRSPALSAALHQILASNTAHQD